MRKQEREKTVIMTVAGTVTTLLKVMISHASGLIIYLKVVISVVHVQKLKENIEFAINSKDPMIKLVCIVASHLLCISYVKSLLLLCLTGVKHVEGVNWIMLAIMCL